MKKSLLFVCLGNICRSPSAEAVMKDLVKKEGLENNFYIDSAGTSGWHNGGSADSRMISHAMRRGIELTSISRKFYPDSDFEKFDMIIGMDDSNINDLVAMSRNENERNKIYKMTDFCTRFDNVDMVPDPYYGGDKGFELVLDILEDACSGLLNRIKLENK